MGGPPQINIEIKPSSPEKQPDSLPEEDTFEINPAFAGASGHERLSTSMRPPQVNGAGGRRLSLSAAAAAADGGGGGGGGNRRLSLTVPGVGLEIPGGLGMAANAHSSTSVKQAGGGGGGANMRRASVTGSNVSLPFRRASVSLGGPPPPISRNDIEAAFEELSSDGKRITKEDVTRFVELYFPKHNDKLPKNAAPLLKDLQKEISKDALFTMLVRRPLKNPPFEDVFQVFEPNDDGISPDFLKKMIQKLSKMGLPQKGDQKKLLGIFDVDHDGHINLQDFKLMTRQYY